MLNNHTNDEYTLQDYEREFAFDLAREEAIRWAAEEELEEALERMLSEEQYYTFLGINK